MAEKREKFTFAILRKKGNYGINLLYKIIETDLND